MPDEWERDPDWVKARELEEMGIEQIMGRRNRMELDLGYASLSDQLGSWRNARVMYLRRELTFTYFFELNNFLRKQGDGVQLSGGVTKDWKPWFYTHSALAAGTNSDYLPLFRFDQDFNFKFGPKEKFRLHPGRDLYRLSHRSQRPDSVRRSQRLFRQVDSRLPDISKHQLSRERRFPIQYL